MDETAAALIALESWTSITPNSNPQALPRMTNPIWLVHGHGGQRFVLKRLPEYPPGVGPVDEFRVLGYLQTHHVPVALPIITDGGHIYATTGDERYALLPYVEASNDNPELGPHASETAHAIGSAIGHLDRVLATCPWEVPSYVDDPGPEILGDQLPALPSEDALPVLQILDRLWAGVSDLPSQRTHGDCNTGNVLVFDGVVTGFIDLDHLPLGPRIRDLSYYLASRLRRHLVHTGTPERDLAAFVAVLADYVSGYDDAYPLSEHERAAVVPLMLIAEIGSAHWSRHGWTPNIEHYRQAVETMAWIVGHFDELLDATDRPVGRADR